MSHDAYSALSDPTRRRILAVLHGGARPVGDLVTELGVSQPTVSKHLKVLRDAGMVTTRAQGQKRFYSIAAEPFVPVVEWLTDLVAAAQAQDVPEPGPGVAPQPTPEPQAASEPEVTHGTADVEPEPGRRSAPWFTAETADAADAVTPAEEQDTVETDAAAAAGDETDAVEMDLVEVGLAEAEVVETGGAELEDDTDPADAVLSDAPITEAPVADAPAAEDAGASVGDGVHAESAVPRPAEGQDEPRDIRTRRALEQIEVAGEEETMRPRGGAHRRQSGLLSTLTGFRRRGRGSRRD